MSSGTAPGDRGVLDGDRQQRSERRQHAHDRLRKQDAAHELGARHAERERRASLSRPHRFDAGTHDLRSVGRQMHGQADQCGGERGHRDAGDDRQGEVGPYQHHQHGNRTHRVDVQHDRHPQPAGAVHAKKRDDQPRGEAREAGDHRQENCDPDAVGEESPVVANDGEVEFHRMTAELPSTATSWCR